MLGLGDRPEMERLCRPLGGGVGLCGELRVGRGRERRGLEMLLSGMCVSSCSLAVLFGGLDGVVIDFVEFDIGVSF